MLMTSSMLLENDAIGDAFVTVAMVCALGALACFVIGLMRDNARGAAIVREPNNLF